MMKTLRRLMAGARRDGEEWRWRFIKARRWGSKCGCVHICHLPVDFDGMDLVDRLEWLDEEGYLKYVDGPRAFSPIPGWGIVKALTASKQTTNQPRKEANHGF